MAKFTSFDAPQGVAGPTDSGTATADHFGTGKALASVGSSIAQFGGILREREDKRAITSARAQFSEFQLQFQQDELTRQMAAPVGAPGHYKQSQQAFDDGVAKLTANMNDVQRNALGGLIATARTSNLTSSMKFQAQSVVKGDLNNIGVIQRGIGAQLHRGEINLSQSMNLLKESLVDTTIGAAGQQELITKALPEFRQQVMNGLIANPELGLQKLRNGELRGFPPDELTKLKDDLVAGVVGLSKKRENEAFAVAAVTHADAFDAATGSGTVQEVDAASRGLPEPIRNKLRKIAIDRDRPVRTIEEKTEASADLMSRYEELGVKLKKGKRSSKAAMEDLLRFQSEATDLVHGGFISPGEARRYIRNVEEIVQKKIGDAGSGIEALDYFDIYSQTPFNMGMDRVNKHVEDGGLGAGAHVDIARRFNEYLDGAKLTQSSAQTESRDAQVNELADRAIKDYVQSKIPATRGMKDIPNAIISNGKITPGLPGKRDVQSTKTVASGTQVMADRNGNHARVTKDANGKVVDIQPITKEEALRPALPPPHLTTDEGDGRVRVELPAPDSTPTIEPNLTIDEGESDAAASEDLDPAPDRVVMKLKPRTPSEKAEDELTSIDAFQQRLADEAEDELTGIDAAASEDLDPAPERGVMKLKPRTPSEKAIDIVQGGLLANEGVGDTMTGILTGEGGITEVRKKEIERKKGRPLTDEQARNEAVREDSAALIDGMPGFATLRATVQAALVDMAYNVGAANVLTFNNLRAAVASGNVGAILLETLDTAVVGGKSVSGLALRRARMFNQASRDFRITEVEQLTDGTINYLSGTEVLFTFKLPKHRDSRAGVKSVDHG